MISYNGLVIAGLSGYLCLLDDSIYKPLEYSFGYFEQLPFNDNAIRSIYHVRQFQIYRLAQINNTIDVFLSHV
jgi:lariat debranching enzyme